MARKPLEMCLKDVDLEVAAQMSEASSSCIELTLTGYEVLARVYGTSIVPHIGKIMYTLIKVLTAHSGSSPAQQACSKVIVAITTYGMDRFTPIYDKRDVIRAVCEPLSDSLQSSQESLASGAALCLKNLVGSDNWQFASNDIVNEVCLRVAGALGDKSTEGSSLMGLAVALAKHNNLTLEAYARSLIRSGLRHLKAGIREVNFLKQSTAIQMVSSLMQSLDAQSIFSEIEFVIEELERFHSFQPVFVRDDTFKALQIARTLSAERRFCLENDPSPATGSNVCRRGNDNKRKLWNTASLKSDTLDSFNGYDTVAGSSMSIGHISCNLNGGSRYMCREVCDNENGTGDVFLRDGLYHDWDSGSDGDEEVYVIRNGEIRNYERDISGELLCFVPTSPNDEVVHRSSTSIPKDLNYGNSNSTRRPARRSKSPILVQNQWNQMKSLKWNGQDDFQDSEYRSSLQVKEQGLTISQFVPSTRDAAADVNQVVSHQLDFRFTGVQSSIIQRKSLRKTIVTFICDLFILLAVILAFIWTSGGEELFHLPPT